MNIPFQIMYSCIAKRMRLSAFALMFVAFESIQGAAMPTALAVHSDHYLGTPPYEMLKLAPLPQPIQERTGAASSFTMQKPLEMRSMHNLQYQQAQPRINSDGTANFLLYLDIGHYFDPRFSPEQIAYLTSPRPGGPVAIQIAKQQEAEDKAARDPNKPIRVLSLNTLQEGFYSGFAGSAALEREKRQQNTASFLKEIEDHDIICFQEDDGLITPLPSAPIRHSENNLTIIASSKFIEIQRSKFRPFTGFSAPGKGFLALALTHLATNVQIGVINTHVNWTNTKERLPSQMRDIVNLINEWKHIRHWILCGDFNISLRDFDPVKNAYNIAFDVLKQKGLEDTYTLAREKPTNPNGQLKARITNVHPFTIPATHKGQFDTLDYIFCSGFAVKKITTIPAGLDVSKLLAHDVRGGDPDKNSNYFSDHLGISVELFVEGFEQGMSTPSSSTSTTIPQPAPTTTPFSSAPIRQPSSSSVVPAKDAGKLMILEEFLKEEYSTDWLLPNPHTANIEITTRLGKQTIDGRQKLIITSMPKVAFIDANTGEANFQIRHQETGLEGTPRFTSSQTAVYTGIKPNFSAPLAVPAPTVPSVAAIPVSLSPHTPIATSLTTQSTTLTEIHPSHYTIFQNKSFGVLNYLNGTKIEFYLSDQKPAFDQNGKTNLEALDQLQLIRLPQNQLALYAAPRVHPHAQSHQPSQALAFRDIKDPRTDIDVFSLNLLKHSYYRRHSGQTGAQDTPSLGVRQKATRSQFPQDLLEQFDIICLQEYDSTNALLGDIKHFNLIADKELCIYYNGGSLIFDSALNAPYTTPSQVKAKAFKNTTEKYYLPLILAAEGQGGTRIGIINTHLPFATTDDSQLAQLAEIAEYIRSKPEVQHWIICGDFNVNIRAGGPGGLLYHDLFFNRSLPIQGASSFVNTLGLQDAFGRTDHTTRVTMVHSGGQYFNTTDYIWTSGFQTIAHKTLPEGLNKNKLLTHVTATDKDNAEYFSDHFALAARLRITDSSSSSSTSSTIPGGPNVPREAQQSTSSTSSTSSSSYPTGTAALQANLSLLYASLLTLSSKR